MSIIVSQAIRVFGCMLTNYYFSSGFQWQTDKQGGN